jgi:hypothetical protein
LNLAIVGPMLTVKELMLSPDGTLFEPLGADAVDDVDDDPQPAAIRPATAAKPTQPTPPKRPLPLLPRRITHAPFARRHPNKRTLHDV